MKFQKKILVSMLIAIFVVGSAISVSAREKLSNYIESSAVTAGSWYSGYDNDNFYNMSSSFKEVYGGDVGMYFYTTSVGLSKAFVKKNTRTVVIQLKEEDPGNDENELVRTYVGHFSTRTDGIYQPTTYTCTYTNPECVENNSIVELYYRMYVDRISGDTSRNVPRGISKFKYWIE